MGGSPYQRGAFNGHGWQTRRAVRVQMLMYACCACALSQLPYPRMLRIHHRSRPAPRTHLHTRVCARVDRHQRIKSVG